MSVIHRRGPARPSASLTPMIDVVFLLVVFFVAVSQIVDRDRLDLDLPAPRPSAAATPSEGPRVVVNVLPAPDGTARGDQADGRRFAPDDTGRRELATHLRQRLQDTPQLFINVRADQSTAWGWIAPVLESARRSAARTSPPQPFARVRLTVAEGGN